MKYIRHDYFMNFNGAVKSNERRKAQSMFAQELGELVHINKFEVIEALNNAGIKTSKDASGKEIITKVVRNSGDNKKLADNITTLLSFKNDMKRGSDYSHSAAGTSTWGLSTPEDKPDKPSAKKSVLGGILGTAATALTSILGGGASKAELEAEKEKTRQEALKTLAQLEGRNTRTALIIGGVVILGIVGIVAWRFRKK